MSGAPVLVAPLPPAGVVDVWRVELDDPRWQLVEDLPPADRERAARLHASATRRRWTAARLALRMVLARYSDGGATWPVEFVFGPHGKPSLPGPGPIRFNLSHSDALALVAVTVEVEVGVDVERVDRGRDVDALIPLALDDEDAAAVRAASADRRAEAFHRAWVRREAIVKCGGQGLGGRPPAVPITATPIDLDGPYVAALAVAAPVPAQPRLLELAPPSMGVRCARSG
ncbi:MAG TPA: 4'-phosphopantetheinyl transferase superfamily protein [Solirubrobacterales bacterium]|nr:4'-phosphopantetheinyl transferase superfamily protein [Solirubrobacterales bacterium]